MTKEAQCQSAIRGIYVELYIAECGPGIFSEITASVLLIPILDDVYGQTQGHAVLSRCDNGKHHDTTVVLGTEEMRSSFKGHLHAQ